jgi:hypothetical protein
MLLMVGIVPWLLGGCEGLFSWLAKDDSPPHPAQVNERPAMEVDRGTTDNRPQVLDSRQPAAEATQQEDQAAPGEVSEPVAPLSEEERSLEERVHAQGISQASADIHQIQRIGDDLGLKLFLDRLNVNVGRITFSGLVKKWGLPQELADGGTVVLATWRWLTSPDRAGPEQPDTEEDQPEKHGEQVTLSFDKSSQVLVNWQYGRW